MSISLVTKKKRLNTRYIVQKFSSQFEQIVIQIF